MIFGQQINHLVSGFNLGYAPRTIDIKLPSNPLIFNVSSEAQATALNNLLANPKPKVFIGQIKMSVVGNSSHTIFEAKDVNNDTVYSFQDNDNLVTVHTFPLTFKSVTTTLTAKYSFMIFGYIWEYN